MDPNWKHPYDHSCVGRADPIGPVLVQYGANMNQHTCGPKWVPVRPTHDCLFWVENSAKTRTVCTKSVVHTIRYAYGNPAFGSYGPVNCPEAPCDLGIS